jgi:hypothetical protein
MSNASKHELDALIVAAAITELPQDQFDQRRIHRETLLLKLLSDPCKPPGFSSGTVFAPRDTKS